MAATPLADAMSARNISVRGLAAMVGRSRTTVGRWVTGERVPPSRMRAVIAGKFKMPLDDLFGGDGREPVAQAEGVNSR